MSNSSFIGLDAYICESDEDCQFTGDRLFFKKDDFSLVVEKSSSVNLENIDYSLFSSDWSFGFFSIVFFYFFGKTIAIVLEAIKKF